MYDFTHAPKRQGTDSVKWHVEPGELPMWIADMDFATAPEIVTALQAKLQLGAFGYEEPQASYFAAVASWYQQVHHAQADPSWMTFATGVVPAISAIVRRVTDIGDNVLVQAPVYNIFYNSIENNGRHVLASDLQYAAGQYAVDWADLEAKLAAPLTTLMILCNPHNPIGKVWTKAELTQLAELCLKHLVILLADEIHGDLVLAGADYTPVFSLEAELRQNTITLVSPSKTFNVAALHAATAIVPDPALHARVDRGLNRDEVAEPNLLAIPGTIAAYTKGAAWLTALKQQLWANHQLAVEFIQQELPQVRVASGPATYLMWLDVHAYGQSATALTQQIRQRTGLIVSDGTVYRGNGDQFLRLNFACPEAMLQDGLARLKRGLAE
ncbi:MalY/PatB family protein [Lacticaseibacillus nasuensis]|uniref:MalY/PatB family protein n=1 Tax=Lacticaseibacillus nasuensis TaxID=944671 RepID=UPI002246FF4F|nr:MalY/PatB family protein [Lacticaseibacillus nasuensis]MCX2456084.1 pyridoxal phosphate-dependent aminotransferase [Lacticaseibacillus nasuensis]